MSTLMVQSLGFRVRWLDDFRCPETAPGFQPQGYNVHSKTHVPFLGCRYAHMYCMCAYMSISMCLYTYLYIYIYIDLSLPLNMIGPEQGETHVPIQTTIQRSGTSPRISFQTPSFQTNESNISTLTLRWMCVPCPFHICSMPIPYPFQSKTKYLAHAHPTSLVGTSRVSHRFRPSGSSVLSRPAGSDSIGMCTRGMWF